MLGTVKIFLDGKIVSEYFDIVTNKSGTLEVAKLSDTMNRRFIDFSIKVEAVETAIRYVGARVAANTDPGFCNHPRSRVEKVYDELDGVIWRKMQIPKALLLIQTDRYASAGFPILDTIRLIEKYPKTADAFGLYGVEEFETCYRDGCRGVIEVVQDEDLSCSCHINPPCAKCTGGIFTCSECGWEGDSVSY